MPLDFGALVTGLPSVRIRAEDEEVGGRSIAGLVHNLHEGIE